MISQLHERDLAVTFDDREEVIEIMGNAAGKLADRLQFLRLPELLLKLNQLFPGPFTFRNVLNDGPNSFDMSLFIPDETIINEDGKGAPVFAAKAGLETMLRLSGPCKSRQDPFPGAFFISIRLPDKLPQQLFLGVSEHLQAGTVDIDDPALDVIFVVS
jgi:hypothetical protein